MLATAQEDFFEAIRSTLDPATLIPELQPRLQGKSYSILCPSCKKRRGYIYASGGQWLNCNRLNSCTLAAAGGTPLWTYIRDRDNRDTESMFRLFADAAGVNYSELSSGFAQGAEMRKQRAELTAALQAFFVSQLRMPVGLAALEYLRERGYSDEDIDAMGLGYNPGVADTVAHLKAQGFDVAMSAGTVAVNGDTSTLGFYADHLNPYRITFPFRDPAGRIKAFWGRLITASSADLPKYKPFSRVEHAKGTLFNLDKAKRGQRVVLVEGYLDPLIATARGIQNVVSTCGAHLTDAQLEHLAQYSASSIVLALDNDAAGDEGTERAIAKIYAAGLDAFVVEMPGDAKDPDEVIRDCGEETFRLMVEHAMSAAKWQARRIASKAGNTDRGIRAALAEAQGFHASLINPFDQRDFASAIAEHMRISLEEFERYSLQLSKREEREQAKSTLKGLFKQGEHLADAGSIDDLRLLLAKAQNALPSSELPAGPSLPEYLRRKFKVDAERPDGSLLGYRLGRLPDVCEKMDGVQPGLYVIAADTNIGKTALLTTLFIDLIESNSDEQLQGLYFSLDDNKDTIINRLVSILAGVEINNVKRGGVTGDERQRVSAAYETLAEWAADGRLDIQDISEVQTIGAVNQSIRAAVARGNTFVCIDGLYNLDAGSESTGKREQTIDLVNGIKILVDTYKLPVLCTGELRKSSDPYRIPTVQDLMETGKLAYNANVVLTLYPEYLRTIEGEKPAQRVAIAEEYRRSEKQALALTYEKNKLSGFKGTLSLIFNRDCGALTDRIAEEIRANKQAVDGKPGKKTFKTNHLGHPIYDPNNN